MNGSQYNAAVLAAARNQPLGGTRRGGSSKPGHDWKVRVEPATDESRRQVRVYVGTGTVNDRVAAISYLRTDDPRGWKMPEDYRGIANATRLYGKDFALVDRLLTETSDPPHLLLETPSADGSDAGDFERVPDDRSRPPFFRTTAAFEKQLWRAVVFVSATPGRYSRIENRIHFPLPVRNTRFRVAARSRMPTTTAGVQSGSNFELARLYLLRDPAHPERDELHVEQRCFWSLWTTNVSPYLDFLPPILEAAELATLATLTAGGAGLVLGTVILGAEAILVDELLNAIADNFEKGASVEFWTA